MTDLPMIPADAEIAVRSDLPWRRLGAAVAGLQGVLMIGNGLLVAVVVVRDGITGPSAVASPAGVAAEVALYMLFGAALLWMSNGFLVGRSAILTPFMLAQVLGLTVTLPLATGEGIIAVVGAAIAAVCISGMVAWAAVLRGNLRRSKAAAGDLPTQ